MTEVRIITEPLGGGALSQLIQRGGAPIEWFAPAPSSPDAWRARARARAQERDWNEMWDMLAPAMNATGPAAERLERVRRGNGVVITTGQQPGLFGGPVYTWSKALGALAMADTIEKVTGIPTAAIFWAATDDADFAEASYTVVPAAGGAEVLRSEEAPPAGTPMSRAPLGDVRVLLARLRASAGSAADARALDVVARAYESGTRTIGAAFVELLREFLGPLGIPVLDASHDAVRQAGDATLRNALTNAADVERALGARSRALRDAGFTPQVEDVAALSLVFTRDGEIKRRLPVAEAVAVAADGNAVLSPNVLLRPIVEQALLPTIAYMGGPGELAYFAQVSAVADAMGVARPAAAPRWSCTLLEPHIERTLATMGITRDALATPHQLEGTIARAAMAPTSASAIRSLRDALRALPTTLAPESDPMGLSKAVEGGARALEHRLDRIERRLVAGIKRREDARMRDVGTLRGALYPNGSRQERALNLVPMLARHGLDLLGEMHAAAVPHAEALTVGRGLTVSPG